MFSRQIQALNLWNINLYYLWCGPLQYIWDVFFHQDFCVRYFGIPYYQYGQIALSSLALVSLFFHVH